MRTANENGRAKRLKRFERFRIAETTEFYQWKEERGGEERGKRRKAIDRARAPARNTFTGEKDAEADKDGTCQKARITELYHSQAAALVDHRQLLLLLLLVFWLVNATRRRQCTIEIARCIYKCYRSAGKRDDDIEMHRTTSLYRPAELRTRFAYQRPPTPPATRDRSNRLNAFDFFSKLPQAALSYLKF